MSIFGAMVAVMIGGSALVGVALSAHHDATNSVDDAMLGSGADHVRYRGQWAEGHDGRYFSGTEHYSSTAGASATMRFSGTQVALFGGTGPGSGIADVSVDGGPAFEVDFHDDAVHGNHEVWVSAPLSRGPHTITVSVTGTHRDGAGGSFVSVDRFQMFDTRTADAARGHSAGDAFHFAGAWSGGKRATMHSGKGSATYSFTGGAGLLYGVVGRRTTMNVSVDGAPGEVRAPTGHHVLFATGPLAAGKHVIRLSFAGSAVIVGGDAIGRVKLLPERLSQTGTTAGWAVHSGNPVVGKNWGTAFDLAAMYDAGVYRMWFSWRPQGSVAYAESVDGVSWTAPRSVLSPVAGTWQSIVNRPSVLRGPDGRYRMWYTGQQGDSSEIGYAVSDDGIRWTRPSSEPVLQPSVAWEAPSVMNPSVLWDSAAKEYKMWFSGGATYEPNAIGYAVSRDGTHWRRPATAPVLTADPSSAWERDRVAGIQVLRSSRGYLAFYIGYADINTAAIGTARSSDGVHWTDRQPAPIVAPVKGAWDCDAVYKPFAVWVPVRAEWKLWFNGRCGAPEQIGVAVHHGATLR